MNGRSLVIGAVIAAIFAAEFVLRTDTANASKSVSPSATPKKRSNARTETVSNNETITISGRKPKTNNAANRTSTGAGSNPAAAQSSPASLNRRRPRNQDIEVENDETHWVGHDRTRLLGTTNNATVNGSTPKKTRTETVNNNENRTTISGTARPVNSTRKRKGQRPSGNRKPK